MEWVLELVLVLMLAATLFHALRLERALGVLKQDRAQLEELVGAFNASTRSAESSISRLHEAADGAGRQVGRQIDAATRLKDDLVFLAERGGLLADRLDRLVRGGQALEAAVAPPAWTPPRHEAAAPAEAWPVAAELRAHRSGAEDPADPSRLRSQAERDLMKALRLER